MPYPIPPRPRAAEAVSRAYVNHGRWVVDCECGNAVEAVTDPLPYQIRIGQKKWRCEPWTPEAHPDGFCGSRYTVLWPRHADRIMAILKHRPRASNQNWMPGEPLSLLVAENLEHGCAVPDDEVGA